jgi:hypothetical protein
MRAVIADGYVRVSAANDYGPLRPASDHPFHRYVDIGDKHLNFGMRNQQLNRFTRVHCPRRGDVTQNAQGLGLGPYIASQIAKARGGDLQINRMATKRISSGLPL